MKYYLGIKMLPLTMFTRNFLHVMLSGEVGYKTAHLLFWQSTVKITHLNVPTYQDGSIVGNVFFFLIFQNFSSVITLFL